jgi:hypothetical protein
MSSQRGGEEGGDVHEQLNLCRSLDQRAISDYVANMCSCMIKPKGLSRLTVSLSSSLMSLDRERVTLFNCKSGAQSDPGGLPCCQVNAVLK